MLKYLMKKRIKQMRMMIIKRKSVMKIKKRKKRKKLKKKIPNLIKDCRV